MGQDLAILSYRIFILSGMDKASSCSLRSPHRKRTFILSGMDKAVGAVANRAKISARRRGLKPRLPRETIMDG